MRFTIIAPDYSRQSAGLWSMYRLGDLLVDLGHEVLSWSQAPPGWAKYRAMRPGEPLGIPVVPEIFQMNNGDRLPCMRWVLNAPGKLGGPTRYTRDEIIFHFADNMEEPARAASADGTTAQLWIGIVDPREFAPDPGLPRDLVTFWPGRRPGFPKAPDPLALRLMSTWPPVRDELVQVLKRSKTFYCYERDSLLGLEAFLAGADVRIWDGEAWTPYTPDDAHVDRHLVNDERDRAAVAKAVDRVQAWLASRGQAGRLPEVVAG
jgi:O-antigen biosynthesis protein